jgi:putative Holliday junction resolvase
MGRIICLDYGLKRTGIAVSDPMQIIASPLDTIATQELMPFLKTYIATEPVDKILIGEPYNLDGTETHATKPVKDFIRRLKKAFPHIVIETVDEQFSSKMAVRAMIEMNLKKKKRSEKGMIDRMAAALLLKEYLENNS